MRSVYSSGLDEQMDFAGFACGGLNTSDFRDSLVSPVSCFYFFGKIAKQLLDELS